MIRVFVFSFRRHEYLERLLESIERFLPRGTYVHVLDDGSKDPRIDQIIQSRRLPFTDSSLLKSGESNASRLGSLYQGLNHAI